VTARAKRLRPMVPLRSRKPASVISAASCWLPTIGSPPSVQMRPSVCPVGGVGHASRVGSGRILEPDEERWGSVRDEEREQVLAELARLSSDVQRWAEEVVGRIDAVTAAVNGATISPARSAGHRVRSSPTPGCPGGPGSAG